MEVFRPLTYIHPIPKSCRSMFGTIQESTSYSPDFSDISSPIAPASNAINREDVPKGSDPFKPDADASSAFHEKKHEDDLFLMDKPLTDLIFADEEDDDNEASILEASSSQPKVQVYGITDEQPKKKVDVVKQHLQLNSPVYNNLLFNPEEYLSALQISNTGLIGKIIDRLYPSFKIHTYASRDCSSCGGIFSSADREVVTKQIEDYIKAGMPETMNEDMNILIHTLYNHKANWYKTAYEDLDHIVYCYKLRATIKCILSNSDACIYLDDVVSQWETRVLQHYEMTQKLKPYSQAYMRELQALHDLFWDPLDNPNSIDDRTSNAISFLLQIGDESGITPLQESRREMVAKEDLTAWLRTELDPESLSSHYLLPEKNQYPILCKSSLKYAMDFITKVDEGDRKTYAANLNRLCHEFGIDFKISVDHPYAKYIDVGKYPLPPEMILVNILEGVVEDKDFTAELKKTNPQVYRVVTMDSKDAESTVYDLDPDHKKNKAKVEGVSE